MTADECLTSYPWYTKMTRRLTDVGLYCRQKRKDARNAEKDVSPEHFAYVKSPDTDAHDVAF
jgi:hypothetical protein